MTSLGCVSRTVRPGRPARHHRRDLLITIAAHLLTFPPDSIRERGASDRKSETTGPQRGTAIIVRREPSQLPGDLPLLAVTPHQRLSALKRAATSALVLVDCPELVSLAQADRFRSYLAAVPDFVPGGVCRPP